MNALKSRGLILCLSLFTALGSCDQVPTIVPPDELFPEIEYVVDHKDGFAQSEDNPLADVEAGTVLDDLSDLDGCWGAYDFFEYADTDAVLQPLDNYEVYRFDTSTGQAEWQFFQSQELPIIGGRFDALGKSQGMLEIANPGLIKFTTAVLVVSDPTTGDLITMPAEELHTDEFPVTIAGEYMKIHGAIAEVNQLDDLVFKRFECNDPCRSQCELASGACQQRPLSEFGDYQPTLEEWTERTRQSECDDAFTLVAAGTCETPGLGGQPTTLLFLHDRGPYVSITYYFDAASERFLSLTTTTDVVDEACGAKGYWPFYTQCSNALVTELLCGTSLVVGDLIHLP